MVLKATKKVRDLKNVTVQQGNVTALSFPDSHFDVVIESLVFHHLTDTQKQTAIAEIKRVLKSGGLFYFVDWVKVQIMSCQIDNLYLARESVW